LNNDVRLLFLFLLEGRFKNKWENFIELGEDKNNLKDVYVKAQCIFWFYVDRRGSSETPRPP
jgi:hypothetical protein